MSESQVNVDSEYRWDPFEGRWVILASGRSARPYEFAPRPVQACATSCSFCADHEAETPPELARWSLPDSRYDWDVRAVPNKYPAVTAITETNDHESRVDPTGLWQTASPAVGIHEVIIDAADHVSDMTELTVDHLELVLNAYCQRLTVAARTNGIRFGLVFKNVGADAGASIEHAHSQLLALPMVPPPVQAREQRQTEHWQRTGQCLVCQWLESELQAAERVVETTDDFAMVCPFFSRFPGEIWIVPRRHQTHFHKTEAGELFDLANQLRSALVRLHHTDSSEAYNVVFQSSSFDVEYPESAHWVVQVLPRRVAFAGFEWTTGCFINTLTPEQAAVELRHRP